MDALLTRATPLTLQRGFNAVATALAARSLTHPDIAGQNWRVVEHPYRRMRYPIMRSDDNGWGVAGARDRHAMFGELLMTRIAALGQLPIAPVFYHEKCNGNLPNFHTMISVIPFDNIAIDEKDMHDAPNIFRHVSWVLPLHLWISPHSDRGPHNVCMNVDNTRQFAEFDYGVTNISTKLARLEFRKKSGPEEERRIFGVEKDDTFSSMFPFPDVDFSINERDFKQGLCDINAIPDKKITDTIYMLAERLGVDPEITSMVNEYILIRRKALNDAYDSEHFYCRLPDLLDDVHPVPKFETYSFT
jgi:hypothetical protein